VKTSKAQDKRQQEFLKKLGERIVQLRKEKKMSQQDLAYAIGWDKPNLRKIEKGKVNLTVKSLLLISEGLGISIQDLTLFE
jgi:transcriptional regulator with XRE-family HTH domain